MLWWCADSAMRGVQMQLEQSSVGKTLFSAIILPADRRLGLHQQHLEALLGHVERRLHAGDPAADDQSVVVWLQWLHRLQPLPADLA